MSKRPMLSEFEPSHQMKRSSDLTTSSPSPKSRILCCRFTVDKDATDLFTTPGRRNGISKVRTLYVYIRIDIPRVGIYAQLS